MIEQEAPVSNVNSISRPLATIFLSVSGGERESVEAESWILGFISGWDLNNSKGIVPIVHYFRRLL